jgi:hypothetical protein
MTAMPYVYFWNRMGRKGQPCEVLSRGRMNTVVVRFADGFRTATSRYAVRRSLGLAGRGK